MSLPAARRLAQLPLPATALHLLYASHPLADVADALLTNPHTAPDTVEQVLGRARDDQLTWHTYLTGPHLRREHARRALTVASTRNAVLANPALHPDDLTDRLEVARPSRDELTCAASNPTLSERNAQRVLAALAVPRRRWNRPPGELWITGAARLRTLLDTHRQLWPQVTETGRQGQFAVAVRDDLPCEQTHQALSGHVRADVLLAELCQLRRTGTALNEQIRTARTDQLHRYVALPLSAQQSISLLSSPACDLDLAMSVSSTPMPTVQAVLLTRWIGRRTDRTGHIVMPAVLGQLLSTGASSSELAAALPALRPLYRDQLGGPCDDPHVLSAAPTSAAIRHGWAPTLVDVLAGVSADPIAWQTFCLAIDDDLPLGEIVDVSVALA